MPTRALIASIYPDLYPVHGLTEQGGISVDDEVGRVGVCCEVVVVLLIRSNSEGRRGGGVVDIDIVAQLVWVDVVGFVVLCS